jgi:ribosomal protein S12 methylthiotransferase accessory factor
MSEVPRDDFSRPVVFLGPSLELEHARRILPASYRLPIKRGDLVDVPPGALVGIIDGVFQHSASVSPREIHRAVERGVRIFGASSMGALRALEVSGMIGVGSVYEMYRDGLIVSDDEVALALDPDTQKPLTVPLVNVRFAIDRLVRSGTLDRALGDRIVEAAIRLHFAERTYPAIMAEAGLGARADVRDLIVMLAQIDLKREDAHTLLETLASVVEQGWAPPSAGAAVDERPDYGAPDSFHEIRAAQALPADAPVSIWETGDRVAFLDLVFFLRMTGKLDEHARNALARFVMDGNELDPAVVEEDAQVLFSYMCTCWGWMTGEEAHVTTRDLGLGLDDLGERCGEELAARAAVRAIVSEGSEELLRALRAELFMNDLALKRETMRLGSLERLAAQGREAGPLGAEEIAAARGRLAALNRLDWARLQGDVGLSRGRAGGSGQLRRHARVRAPGSACLPQEAGRPALGAGPVAPRWAHGPRVEPQGQRRSTLLHAHARRAPSHPPAARRDRRDARGHGRRAGGPGHPHLAGGAAVRAVVEHVRQRQGRDPGGRDGGRRHGGGGEVGAGAVRAGRHRADRRELPDARRPGRRSWQPRSSS